MTGGRPLRFLAMTLGGWTMIRIALVLSDGGTLPDGGIIPSVIKILVPEAVSAVFVKPRGRLLPPAKPTVRAIAAPIVAPGVPGRTLASNAPPLSVPSEDHRPFILPPHVEPERQTRPVPSPLAPPAHVSGANRLNGSAWFLVRGGPSGTVSGGQLGASQGGVRVTYALGRQRRFALAARLAAPLRGKGREAALGIEWQPTALPIRLIAEQRFVLDGGRGGPTLGIIAGYGPADIAPGVRVEAYGQAGVIARDGLDRFIDASARLTHPLGHVAGARIDIGLGIWGSAQRAAERFDIGPSLVVGVPIAGKSLRLTLDWRERVAGAARPGSGPALSIGSDF